MNKDEYCGICVCKDMDDKGFNALCLKYKTSLSTSEGSLARTMDCKLLDGKVYPTKYRPMMPHYCINGVKEYMGEGITKYQLGQVLYPIIERGYYNALVDCPICNSTGVVNIKGEEFPCPKCKGTSKAKKIVYLWSAEITKLMVLGIQYVIEQEPEYYFDYDISNTADYDDSCGQWGQRKFLVKESNLFLTREEASLECEVRNLVSKSKYKKEK